jgi:hypothetical protein
MSGLEPLVALGIACNAIQCLSFGHEVISLCKRHFESGSADPSVADNAAILSSYSTQLRNSLDSARKPLSKEESELLSVSRNCLVAATKLIAELDKIRGESAKGRLLASICASLRLLKRKSKIEGLEKAMRRYQDTLNFGLLHRIW